VIRGFSLQEEMSALRIRDVYLTSFAFGACTRPPLRTGREGVGHLFVILLNSCFRFARCVIIARVSSLRLCSFRRAASTPFGEHL
jgi:hypothetical protein